MFYLPVLYNFSIIKLLTIRDFIIQNNKHSNMIFTKNNKIVILAALLGLLAAGILIYNKYKTDKPGTSTGTVAYTAPANMPEKFRADFDEAVKILAEKNNDYDALLTIARIKNLSGDYRGAVEVYEKMVNIKDKDILPYLNMGDAYNSLKDYDKSGEMYEKVIEINPKWVNAYRQLYNLYKFGLTHKYDDRIEGILQSGLKISQDMGGEGYSDFYAMLGMYYKGKGNKEKAIENFNKALELDPDNGGVKSELEELKK